MESQADLAKLSRARLPPQLQAHLRTVNIRDVEFGPVKQKLRDRAMSNMNSYLRVVNIRLEVAQLGACISMEADPGAIESGLFENTPPCTVLRTVERQE